jgi:HlyD family secretion protein
MNLRALSQTVFRLLRRRPVLSAIVGIVVIALAIILLTTSGPPVQAFSFYEVKRGDFLVSIVEGGTLEAVNEVEIRSEVEGTARIIYIVPEGSYAKKGELVVELDSANSQDAVNLQQINVEKAQFSLVQAEQQLDIQKSTVESEIQAATLKVEFAESDLEKFTKGQALQAQRNAQIEITNVLESLQIAQERLDWSEKLYKDGFETKANLDKDRLAVSQSKLRLEQTQRALWMVETFDNPKSKRSLEAALQEAKENLDRVKLQGERKLAQSTADVETQKKTLELSQAKLDREKQQLVATKIYAPQDGLVVYASAGGGHFSSESMIEEGATVRNRQEIIKLPDVAEMKLRVKIHESHINQLRLDQPAFVVLDSMPDQRFRGKVNKVAPLPDSQSRYGNPDLKVYATEILITDKLPDVKPGVSARAEIIITNLTDTLSVPIQAVTTRKGKQVVFLASAPQAPVPVTVGLFNTKFIEISSGLKEGDQVLLAPPFDSQEKDLGGAIIADGETLPAGATNPPPRSAARATEGNDNSQSGSSRREGERPSGPGALAAAEDSDARGRSVAAEGVRGGGESPRDGMRTGKRGRSGANGFGGSSTNRQDMLKRFDADGDGKLNETELATMRESAGRRRGTNAPPARSLVN